MVLYSSLVQVILRFGFMGLSSDGGPLESRGPNEKRKRTGPEHNMGRGAPSPKKKHPLLYRGDCIQMRVKGRFFLQLSAFWVLLGFPFFLVVLLCPIPR